ncbi:MAG: 6-phosphogluconolactonase [Candidatus Levybacteria bacterium]|nr:6-phosphogluconolactonase [Candidatus Levybacteria bacterium]
MDRSTLLGLNHFKNKDNILVIESPTAQSANETISEILEKYCDLKTTLFLSGGNTPKKLYEYIAAERKLKVGAVGQVDERYGEKNHKKSNELMMKETGLLDYFESSNLRFYSILQSDESLENTALQYDEALRFILKYFPKSVGIMGLGEDGHTAGIPAIPEISKKMIEDGSALVSFYDAPEYGQRITMNYHAISVLDLIIVLVLGQDKREILNQMFKFNGEQEEIEKFPAKFYLKPEIASKTILITDQIV